MKQHYLLAILAWLLIALGIGLRLDQYLFNRSLWLDEAFFAVNFLHRDIWTVLQLPLDYSHSHIAPPAFMLITQLSIEMFGNFDYILRLYPLVCGVLSVIAFYFLARITVSPLAVPVAVFLFAISDTLIIYSSDFKQYSSDVLTTIVLLWLAVSWQQLDLTKSRAILLTILGVVIVWFSHSAVLVLATISSYWGLQLLYQRNWQQLSIFIFVGIAWLISAITMYKFVSNGGVVSSPIGEWLLAFWDQVIRGFMPNPLTTAGQQWLFEKLTGAFNYPANLGQTVTATYVPAMLFVFGCLILFVKKRQLLYLSLVPILLTLVLSYLHAYPFADRLILFLLPIFYLVIAEAIAQIKFSVTDYPDYMQRWTTYAFQIGLIFVLVYPLNSVSEKYQKQEIKPLMQYLAQHGKQDKLYLFHWAEPAFRYYAPQYGFDYGACHLISPISVHEFTKEVDYFRQKNAMQPVNVNETSCILGTSELFHKSLADLQQLKGQGRVWFLFAHHFWREKDAFLAYLDEIGTRLDSQYQYGTELYLYKL
ncbi:hypothetical protein [Candidatus Albibeggiatoa sp. nov. NOAA]|uniref:hypothetical protein n=1 Tax=Candidatus Albibeggiatoa sp. nov. NOAA TaxID=3162724 RepID=UPI0032FF775A|nr:hypothetical protein [Thiotrichaceae bacterium]